MTKETLVIYHHPCLDGFTSAYVAYTVFGDHAEYVPATYSNEEDLPDVLGRNVYLVDFSYPEDTMRKIASLASRVVVLDHHKTAQDALAPLFEEGIVDGVFDMKRSGAGITWDYFYPGEPRPEFINYVEDRDIWKFEIPNSKAVNMAMFSYEYDFRHWNFFATEDGMATLQAEGGAILRKHMKDIHELSEHAQMMTIGGYEVPVVNVNYMFGSDLCSILAEDHPFAAYYWANKHGALVFGLRSLPNTVDVGKVAAQYGGGGHVTASGFRVASLDDL